MSTPTTDPLVVQDILAKLILALQHGLSPSGYNDFVMANKEHAELIHGLFTTLGFAGELDCVNDRAVIPEDTRQIVLEVNNHTYIISLPPYLVASLRLS